MKPFSYTRVQTVGDAVAALVANLQAHLIAGGTNIVDLMKYEVTKPEAIVDINRLPLKDIEDLPDGAIRIGALASNSAMAYDPRIRACYPLLSTAILAGASPQLRNAASVGVIFSSEPVAIIFMIPRRPAISAIPDQAVRRSGAQSDPCELRR